MSELASQTKHQTGNRYSFKQPLRVKALLFPLPVGAVPKELTFKEGLYRYPSNQGYGFEGTPLEDPGNVYYFLLPSLEDVDADPLPFN